MKRLLIIAAALAVFISICPVSASSKYFDQSIGSKGTSINVGDYVSFGKYNNSSIVWKVITKNENGIMIMSEKIISLKAFDSAESGKANKPGGKYSKDKDRQMYGSNDWGSSNIREWLNSSTRVVKYSTQAPSSEAISYSINPYNHEAGFLYYFSDNEKKLIVPVKVATEKATSTDRVFLISEDEFNHYIKNDLYFKEGRLTKELLVKSSKEVKRAISSSKTWYYWLRSSGPSSCSASTIGSDGCASYCYDGWGGVRPALYMKSDAAASRGEGSLQSPYIIK